MSAKLFVLTVTFIATFGLVQSAVQKCFVKDEVPMDYSDTYGNDLLVAEDCADGITMCMNMTVMDADYKITGTKFACAGGYKTKGCKVANGKQVCYCEGAECNKYTKANFYSPGNYGSGNGMNDKCHNSGEFGPGATCPGTSIQGKCFGITMDLNGNQVENFGCSTGSLPLEMLGPMVEKYLKYPEDIQTMTMAMTMNHAGLSMHVEVTIDREALMRIIDELDLDQMSNSPYKKQMSGSAENLSKLNLNLDQINLGDTLGGVINPAMETYNQYMQEESMEISINSDFSMKAGNGGEISVKMALNGESNPNKVMNIEAEPNEMAMQMCMSEDCVLVGMCSEFKCNEKEMFRKLANSATALKNIVSVILLGLLFNKLF